MKYNNKLNKKEGDYYMNDIEQYINTINCVDNLELMKQIPDNSIDLIYCDILYNTGKKFKDYDDKLGTPQQAMEWYKPRLIEMNRILKDTGNIYLQCDYRLVHYLKVEMDKIFEIANFRNDIIWEKSKIKGARHKSKSFGIVTDNILYYTKTNKYKYIQQYRPIDLTAKNNKFKYKNKDGKIYSRDCPLGDYSEKKIAQFEKEGKIYTTKNGKKQLIRYLDEVKGIPIGNLWCDIYAINQVGKERVGYDTQKPKALIERIIKASSNEGDIVADFFCGSGTTGVVAKELNRKYILCDISEKACKISEDRLNDIV